MHWKMDITHLLLLSAGGLLFLLMRDTCIISNHTYLWCTCILQYIMWFKSIDGQQSVESQSIASEDSVDSLSIYRLRWVSGNIARSSLIPSWHSAHTSWSIGRHLTIAQLSTYCHLTVNQYIVWLSMDFWPIYWPTYWLRVSTENMIQTILNLPSQK